MKESYQEEIYSLLPYQFSRKELMNLASSLDINLNSANSYLHSWTKRNLISKVSMGNYKKNSDTFFSTEPKLIPIENVPDTTTITEEPITEDVVLNDFSVKSATDEELLQELVSRGFSWDSMQKIVVTNIGASYQFAK